MGKPTGFLEHPRATAQKRSPSERIGDAREIYLPVGETEIREQASRCMDCGIPFCHQGCPLENLIPDWNDLVFRGEHRTAFERLEETNNFPEFTGRLCPAPCEASCVLGIHADPVTIKEVEVSIADRAFREGWVVPRASRARSGKRVAVVGSGPAGLAFAQQLAREGHEVVVFERADRPGGLLRYGIPDFKMEKSVLDRRLDQMRQEGVEFRCGIEVGLDLSTASLVGEFDAIGLASGALAPRGLTAKGADLSGVVPALTYLEQENRFRAGESIADALRISAKGRRVLILGGGDTGADCLGTAHRQGAAHVTQLEIAPRPPAERGARDPWPLWPQIFRVSPAHEEGGERAFALQTTHLEAGEDGRVVRLHAEPVQWSSGPPVPTGEPAVVFETDLVLVATGYVGPEPSPIYAELGIGLDDARRLSADDRGITEKANVFAMGDARRGASLIVWAIAEGRRAAASCAAHLGGRRTLRSAPPSVRSPPVGQGA